MSGALSATLPAALTLVALSPWSPWSWSPWSCRQALALVGRGALVLELPEVCDQGVSMIV